MCSTGTCSVTLHGKQLAQTESLTVLRSQTVLAKFIPHSHGNRLVIIGVYSGYTSGSWIYTALMGSRIYLGSRIYARKVNWLSDRHGQWGIK